MNNIFQVEEGHQKEKKGVFSKFEGRMHLIFKNRSIYILITKFEVLFTKFEYKLSV